MGLFDRFKRSKKRANKTELPRKIKVARAPDGWQIVIVDQIYLLDVPGDWKVFESDRFRMKNSSETIQFSATNYAKSLETINGFNIQDLNKETEALFKRFEAEGGYEPIDDKVVGDKFVYQAFKVDQETQYFYYTFEKTMKNLLRINFIVRETGIYKPSTKENLLQIGDSIKIRVS